MWPMRFMNCFALLVSKRSEFEERNLPHAEFFEAAMEQNSRPVDFADAATLYIFNRLRFSNIP